MADKPIKLPEDINELLGGLATGQFHTKDDTQPVEEATQTVLLDEDENYLRGLLEMIRRGKKAVIIVETDDDKTKYMLSYCSRTEAIVLLAKVIEATGLRLI